MDRKRRRFSPEKKVEILREHLKNKVPISELCQKYGIHPNLFYRVVPAQDNYALGLFMLRMRSSRKL